MKKRKLNSTNPKYYPVQEEEVKERKELIATINFGKKRKDTLTRFLVNDVVNRF